MERILTTYYANNARKLRKMVDKILRRFYELSDKDKDDFYSLANVVFVDVIRRYDNSQDFDGFLYSCLSNKIKSEITKRHREKRKADRMSISIDAPISEDQNITVGDTIADSFDIEKEIFGDEDSHMYSKRILLYLDRLSSIQKEVLKLNIAGYQPSEIRQKLHMDERQYADCYAAIHSYRNVSVLF